MSSTSSKKTTPKTPKPSGKPVESKAKSSTNKVPAPKSATVRPAMNPKPIMADSDAKTANDSPIMGGAVLKKQELLAKVVEASGIKKKDAKPVVEAMLVVLGEALADGREFNLQPMGKLKLNRTKETPGARIIVAKIRQNKNANTPGAEMTSSIAAAAE